MTRFRFDPFSFFLDPFSTRKLSKNLTCQFEGREYQVTGHGNGYRLRGATVTVCAAFDGRITLLHDGQALAHRTLAEGEPPIPLDDEKTVADRVSQAKAEQQSRKACKPSPDHPWRKGFKPTPATP